MSVSKISDLDAIPVVKTKRSWRRVEDNLTSFAFIVPFLICFIVFLGYPLVFGVYVSLHQWNPLVGKGAFVGIQQYFELFNYSTLQGQEFWLGLRNTVTFVIISVPLLLGVPLIIAYMIYRSPFKHIFRPIYFFPTVLSVTAITTVWNFLLQTQGGPVNEFLHANIPWLVRQPWAWLSIDLATIWWSMGFNMVIIYAALTQVPSSTMEAAVIDGAGGFRTFWNIVLPQIRNVMSFVIVISTIASFNLFAQPMLMTGGGPNNSTKSLAQYIYERGFNNLHMGSASAMAYLLGLILAAISFAQYRLSREEG
jgi:multiple sugar transport system permease protein